MRHRHTTPKLGRTASHRDAMLRNMATDLLRHEHVRTTEARAKALRPYTERLITLGKRETLHARRYAARVLRDEDVLKKLFDEIAPRYAERPGGYTRIIKLTSRAGDGADMALIELVEAEIKAPKKKKTKKRGPRTAAQDTAKAAANKAEVADEPVADEVETAAEASDEADTEPAAAADEAPEESKE